MNQEQHTTKHAKGKHLTFLERAIIQVRLKDKLSPYRIAKEIGCSANTVRNEIKRGTPALYWGTKDEYDACIAQSVYEGHRINSHRTPSFQKVSRFLKTVELRFKENHWSFDACVGYSTINREFARQEMVCTKTLYNYQARGIIGIKSIDLPQKLRRKSRKETSKPRQNRKHLGRSIEERPSCVAPRKRFGDWELDLVIGSNTNRDQVLMTLLERKTRYFKIIRLPNKTSDSVLKAFSDLQKEYGDLFSKVFKTITTDNGSEFSSLSDLEKVAETLVYFTHPYCSYEKGSNERHNGLIRRFFPKGKRVDSLSDDDISMIETWCNTLPRKILQYATPRKLFRQALVDLTVMA